MVRHPVRNVNFEFGDIYFLVQNKTPWRCHPHNSFTGRFRGVKTSSPKRFSPPLMTPTKSSYHDILTSRGCQDYMPRDINFWSLLNVWGGKFFDIYINKAYWNKLNVTRHYVLTLPADLSILRESGLRPALPFLIYTWGLQRERLRGDCGETRRSPTGDCPKRGVKICYPRIYG